MFDITLAVINELDRELVRRREATQLQLEQAALTDCEDVLTGWWNKACLDRTNKDALVFADWCDCCQARWREASPHWTSLDAGFR
jgi:hypothetical protein